MLIDGKTANKINSYVSPLSQAQCICWVGFHPHIVFISGSNQQNEPEVSFPPTQSDTLWLKPANRMWAWCSTPTPAPLAGETLDPGRSLVIRSASLRWCRRGCEALPLQTSRPSHLYGNSRGRTPVRRYLSFEGKKFDFKRCGGSTWECTAQQAEAGCRGPGGRSSWWVCPRAWLNHCLGFWLAACKKKNKAKY